MQRYLNAHEPALLPQEAALLPALPSGTRQTRLRPNMIWPQSEEHFRAFEVGDTVYHVPETPAAQTRGSVAGRSVLAAAGISLPGVTGMSRGCHRHQDQQTTLPCPYALGETPCGEAVREELELL